MTLAYNLVLSPTNKNIPTKQKNGSSIARCGRKNVAKVISCFTSRNISENVQIKPQIRMRKKMADLGDHYCTLIREH